MPVAGVRRNCHGVRTQLVELCSGSGTIGTEHYAGCQNILKPYPALHLIWVVVEMFMLVKHVFSDVLRPDICPVLNHLVFNLRVVLSKEAPYSFEIDLIQIA